MFMLNPVGIAPHKFALSEPGWLKVMCCDSWLSSPPDPLFHVNPQAHSLLRFDPGGLPNRRSW
jgi:hypothetical protein